ncbi:MAG: DUF2490 domain-containing protein [Bacteroidetes bacterium]|nr:DUF2490 domain-containing protein [Fibrella sp.]
MYQRFNATLWLSALAISASAQFGPTRDNTPRQDFQTWYNLSTGLKLNKGWGLSGAYSLRYYREAGTYRGSFFFLTGSKRLTKGISALANYRLGLAGTGNEVVHRLSLGVNFQHADDGWNFSFRPLIQQQRQALTGDDATFGEGTTYLRLKVGVRKKLSDQWRASVSAEPYFLIERDRTRHRSWLNTAGVSYELSDNKAVSLRYIWIPRVDSDREIHVLNVTLDFDIDMRTRKRPGISRNKSGKLPFKSGKPQTKPGKLQDKGEDRRPLPRVNN